MCGSDRNRTMDTNNGSNSTTSVFHRSFEEWNRQQQADLTELLGILSEQRRQEIDQQTLRELVEKNIRHYQEYVVRRATMIRQDPPSFCSPPWCSPLENSFLWIAGCRPTMSIRLFYVLTGMNFEAHLNEFLNNRIGVDKISGASSDQLQRLNELHCRTLREEERLYRNMALLQEDIADHPLVSIAMDQTVGGNRETDDAIETHLSKLRRIIEEADRLRVVTLRELLGILTPLQAVELLAAAKQLHLRFHCWGIRREKDVGSLGRVLP